MTDTDYTKIGPRVGEMFPDFELPDATGDPIELTRWRNDRPALVVFFRSADWWPYCKAQLVELQKVQDELESRGIGVVGISYDPPELLAKFAETRQIRFPLLSDLGSRVIAELGLLDRDLVEHHAAFGIPTRDFQIGVAYPAVFVLDRRGRIVDKRIGENYRIREAALKLLEEALGVSLRPSGERRIEVGPHVQVTAITDSATYSRYQPTRLHVVIEMDPGWHVYGRPIPEGYEPLTVEVEPRPGLELGQAMYPQPHPFRLEGTDEEFNAHEVRCEVIVPFSVQVSAGHGPIELSVRVRYQACSTSECLPPSTVTLALHLDEAAIWNRERWSAWRSPPLFRFPQELTDEEIEETIQLADKVATT